MRFYEFYMKAWGGIMKMTHNILSSFTHSQSIKHIKPLTIPARLFNIHDILPSW